MARYTNGELKRKILRRLAGEKKGLTADALASALRLKKKERPALLLTLGRMEQTGEVLCGKKGRYTAARSGSLRARLLTLNRGFGFARPEDGGADCFIPGRYLNGALPGDTVLVRLGPADSRGPQGEVVQILEEGGRLYTGRLAAAGEKRREVVPDAFIRFPLPVKKGECEAAVGDKVRFRVTFDKQGDPVARIATSYGSADSARVCADAIIDAAGIPCAFEEETVRLAESLRDAGITPRDLEEREDLREWTVFTIDGRDAKDLDDAVSLDPDGDGWRLGVHIADVSHYVREGTPLDREARRRGTSVYFADRVIPMLPEALSNGACSLNAGTDKLTLSAILFLDAQGVLRDAKIKKTVIRSRVRGVYDEVNALFDGTAEEAVLRKYAAVRPVLENMRALARRLKEAAGARGTMDLISSESVFVLDGQGRPVDLFARAAGESEGMIEQFMIAANVAVAAYARRHGLPFVYRVHDQPDPTKLQVLSETAMRLGLKTVRLSTQLDLRELMEEARETAYARLISDRILRSMAKAAYSENPLGHYGLALKDYCHFTSPIRRYPDLSIHRILSDAVAGVPKDELARRYTAFVRESADLSSQYEVRAVTAERECEDCYKAEYMARFLGETFSGVIASVSSFGLFVELPNSAEGLVRIDELPEPDLRYDDVASLVNRRGRPAYTVGDSMTVRVAAIDVSSGRVDFTPVLSAAEGALSAADGGRMD
ncbi:MAG TPA: ribonuclease R [Firmicutes bacterium]|nr:ribonuclease R [Bacillota bacterium]